MSWAQTSLVTRRCLYACCTMSYAPVSWIINNQDRKRKFWTVAVEGNIGSGKTTCLQYFSKFPNLTVLQEPVDKWRNMHGHNLLELMYKDPTRWSLTFQTYVQLTALRQHKKEPLAPYRLMERSLYSAKYCFVENLFQSGLMPEVEYRVLTEWFNWLVANEDLHLDLIVYLQTKPEVVQERIRRRARKEEDGITFDYIKRLHELHEEWLVKETKFALPAPVLVLNADQDVEKMELEFQKHHWEILGLGKGVPLKTSHTG